jgi:hypothetical protein
MMTHHAGFGTDSMTNAAATTFASYFQPSTFGFAPAILIDRDLYPWVDTVPYMTVNGFDTIAIRVATEPAVAGIDLQGTYDPATRQLSLTSTVTFVQAVTPGDIHLNYFLVEDSIIGSGYGWDQKCYDANWANTYFPGQYNASTTYISGYPHRYVQRATLAGGTWGMAGVIPNNPAVNTPYTHTVNYTVPANFNDQKLSVVVFVANHGATKFDRNILNTANIRLQDLSSTGVASQTPNSGMSLYPNPAAGTVRMSATLQQTGETVLELTDMTGRTISSRHFGSMNRGEFLETQLRCDELAEGVYAVLLRNGSSVQISRLVVGK